MAMVVVGGRCPAIALKGSPAARKINRPRRNLSNARAVCSSPAGLKLLILSFRVVYLSNRLLFTRIRCLLRFLPCVYIYFFTVFIATIYAGVWVFCLTRILNFFAWSACFLGLLLCYLFLHQFLIEYPPQLICLSGYHC